MSGALRSSGGERNERQPECNGRLEVHGEKLRRATAMKKLLFCNDEEACDGDEEEACDGGVRKRRAMAMKKQEAEAVRRERK
ncbi:hypothetical protein ACOSQ4_003775 [Xanthoceras sorbifolium]